MKKFTISEYRKDPSKLSSRLNYDRILGAKHQVISGDRLLVEWGDGPQIYTERQAAEYFELRTEQKEVKCRPWKDRNDNVWIIRPESYHLMCGEWVGPEQTILIEE